MNKYVLLLVSFQAIANGSYHHNNIEQPKVSPPKVYNYTTNLYKSDGLAAIAAISSIPELSHKNKHGHTGIGFGFSSVDDENGVAVGITHHCDKSAYKLNLGTSGGENVLGAGVTISFD